MIVRYCSDRRLRIQKLIEDGEEPPLPANPDVRAAIAASSRFAGAADDTNSETLPLRPSSPLPPPPSSASSPVASRASPTATDVATPTAELDSGNVLANNTTTGLLSLPAPSSSVMSLDSTQQT